MRAAVVLLVLLAVAGCGGAVQVEPPAPQGAAATACAKLGPLLPQTLGGAQRTTSSPESPYVAVWGEGEIAVRCGVGRPVRMAPTDQLQEIDGVGWFADPDRSTLFTAITDVAYVETTIAAGHVAPEILARLSGAIGQVTSAKTG
ncbi:DUF3515 domain-containing protein [Nonomuraea endophytica]|uniref:DUF3515 domain-containing protein n=1 Tax=Nonomuraea endophytica TaxID=714136 RepID=A0A7W7ZZR7_9ACTN|nr:DUF3515 domain-containing protein [Nonomuraea endophytica]MBB5076847.1 hypothetical protein [Nonomuraea endophytica]